MDEVGPFPYDFIFQAGFNVEKKDGSSECKDGWEVVPADGDQGRVGAVKGGVMSNCIEWIDEEISRKQFNATILMDVVDKHHDGE